MDSKIPIRILVVSDGLLSFDSEEICTTGSLSTALEQLKGSACFDFQITCLLYKDTPITQLSGYDQLWLFGKESEGELDAVSLQAIKEFMDSGKGVFATGDHGSLGNALCGSIPRIRGMRNWDRQGTRVGNHVVSDYVLKNRLETRTLLNLFDDVDDGCRDEQETVLASEYDGMPKIIEPRFAVYDGKMRPHAILRMPDGSPIKALPDHEHEGACLDDEGEWDDYSANALPMIVADTHTKTGIKNSSSYTRKSVCYGVVAVYDPSLSSGHGRIVTDSTFHHWNNSNVNPFFKKSSATKAAANIWKQIKQYYINVAEWLVPYEKRQESMRICINKLMKYDRLANTFADLDLTDVKQKQYAAKIIMNELERLHGEGYVYQHTCDSLSRLGHDNKRGIGTMLENLQDINQSEHISHSTFKTIQEEVFISEMNKILGVKNKNDDAEKNPVRSALERIRKSNQAIEDFLKKKNSQAE